MTKLRIILQSNNFYYLLLLITLLFVFIRINYIPNNSKLHLTNSFEGIITNLKYDGNKYTIHIKDKEEVIGYYQSDSLEYKLGDKVKIEGTIYEPSNNTIPNTFNYRKYLHNHQIFYLIKINKITLISKNNNIIYQIKNYIIDRSNTYQEKGYIKSFIIGDKTDLEDYSSFQENGISHLFALSGMHIGLLTTILYFIFKHNKYQNLIIISFLIIYLFISNNSASLIRSIIFFILIIINKKYDLNIKTINVLIITIILLLIYNPYYIYDYGFLYSVTVTYGLILSTKYYRKKYLYNLFITSFVAFLFSLPITISMNYEINILSIINNLIIVPLISLIIYPLTLLVFIFKILEPLYNFIIFIFENLNHILRTISIMIIIPKTNILLIIIYYLILLLVIKTNNFKYLFLNILLIISIKLFPLINNEYKIFFLDVNQGDSALITHQNKVILIDTGGVINKTISQNTIKLIKSLGYNHIDLMVLTHGDQDHIKDATYIINNIKVNDVLLNCGSFNNLEQDLITLLNNKKINYTSCSNNYLIGNNKLIFLNTKEYNNENDNSIVTYAIFNNYKFLFMGDASTTREQDILKTYNLPNIDILKVGHHGSKTSSSETFIDEMNPQYTIVSVGKNNRYGHPNKEVLKRLSHSKIYRTDEDGSIMFNIKNNKLKIETCSP